jgi:hypothetical protein
MSWDPNTYRHIVETTRCDDCAPRDNFRADRTLYGEPVRHALYVCEACGDEAGGAMRGYVLRAGAAAGDASPSWGNFS